VFIRFVAGSDGEDHRWLTGVITEVRLLRDAGELEAHEVELLNDTFEWLNENLPCPPFNRSRWPKSTACWFKSEATSCVARMWDFVAVLEEHGVVTRILCSQNPGKVLYEDDFQVVVEEWREID
jgi:hypothetical protein